MTAALPFSALMGKLGPGQFLDRAKLVKVCWQKLRVWNVLFIDLICINESLSVSNSSQLMNLFVFRHKAFSDEYLQKEE